MSNSVKIANKEIRDAFRRTSGWRSFRGFIGNQQSGKDPITGEKLYGNFICHHLDMSDEHYTELSPEHFIDLNNKTHDAVHYLFRFYQRDPKILIRLKAVLDKMVKLNGGWIDDEDQTAENNI